MTIKIIKGNPWKQTGLNTFEGNRRLMETELYVCASNERIKIDNLGNVTIVRRGYHPIRSERSLKKFIARLATSKKLKLIPAKSEAEVKLMEADLMGMGVVMEVKPQ